MAIQVLGLAGSPRPYGNSTMLLDEVLEIGRDRGLRVSKVMLNDLYYKGCQACLGCVENAWCVQSDEIQDVLKALKEAHTWVLASPIYFDGVSGQMKLFFDRLYSLTQDKSKLPGERRGAVIVTYDAGPNEFYDEIARRLGGYLNWFGTFKVVEVLTVPMAGSTKSVRDRPEIMAQVRALSEKLFEGQVSG